MPGVRPDWEDSVCYLWKVLTGQKHVRDTAVSNVTRGEKCVRDRDRTKERERESERERERALRERERPLRERETERERERQRERERERERESTMRRHIVEIEI